MNAITPAALITSIRSFTDPVKESCFRRVWNAVVEFFTMTITYIVDATKASWATLKNVFGYDATSTPVPLQPVVVASSIANGSLAEKLALYRNIPQDSQKLLARSITIFEDTLRRKEEANIAALPAGVKVPDAQLPLKTFKEDWELMMNVVTIAFAVVRAYVFSDAQANARNIPFFNQVVRQDRGRWNPPVIHPMTGVFLHNGGYEMVDVFQDRTVEMKRLRAQFMHLDAREKEIVLDKTDFDGIGAMPISQDAKDVLHGVAHISNLLHQHNVPFNNALQAVHAATNF